MGHHYIPQKYLEGFADPTDRKSIWMFDKKEKRFTHPSIKKAAQEAAFYSPEDEAKLNGLVERPANAVLTRLRSGDRHLSRDDRNALALYVATMLMRVPHRRDRVEKMYPGLLEESIQRISDQLTAIDPELAVRKLSELEDTHRRFSMEIPPEIRDFIRSPWPRENLLSCVLSMAWRILPASPETGFFLTSDNPAFFFEGDSSGSPLSELTFPLSTELALFATCQGPRCHTEFLSASPKKAKDFVREANRRVAFGASRFVFYQAPDDWVRQAAVRQQPRLSRIIWQ